MQTITTPDNVNTQTEDHADTAWLDLLAALPAETHARFQALHMLLNPAWRGVEEREQVEAAKRSPADRVAELRRCVGLINDKGAEAGEWGSMVLEAVAGFDVDMVRELLRSGVRAEHLYMDHEGCMWSIAGRALFEFTHRTQLFGNAAQLWAQRCADIVAMTVQAGGPRWVSVWLGGEVQPVLDLLRARGIELRGMESWQQVGEEVGVTEADDMGDALCMLLESQNLLFSRERAFENMAAQYRFDAMFGAWFDAVVGVED